LHDHTVNAVSAFGIFNFTSHLITTDQDNPALAAGLSRAKFCLAADASVGQAHFSTWSIG